MGSLHPSEDEPPVTHRDCLETHADAQTIRAFLVGQGAPALADRLIAQAVQDVEVSRELFPWRQLTAQPESTEALEALIDDILVPGRNYIAWGTAGAYVACAEAVVTLLASVREKSPEQALELGERAMRSAWKVLTSQADDSFGEIGDFIRRIAREWVAALAASPTQPAGFGQQYLQLLLNEPIRCFDAPAAEAAMGALALGAFRDELALRWEAARAAVLEATRAQLAAMSDASHRVLTVRQHAAQVQPMDPTLSWKIWQFERHHLRQLEAVGDVEGMLEVMQDGLHQPDGYLQISETLERMGRTLQALAFARRGCNIFPRHVQLVENLLRLVEHPGACDTQNSGPTQHAWDDSSASDPEKREESVRLQRQLFELDLGLLRYQRLIESEGALGSNVAALRTEILPWLQAREQAGKSVLRIGESDWCDCGAYQGGPDVGLRAQIVCNQARWEEMLTVLRPPARCHPGVRLGIARALPGAWSEQKVFLLMGVLEEQMLTAKSPHRGELVVVQEIAALLGPLERRRWFVSLANRHRAKRNFVKGLAGIGEPKARPKV